MAKADDITPPLSQDNPATLNTSHTSHKTKSIQLSPELEELE